MNICGKTSSIYQIDLFNPPNRQDIFHFSLEQLAQRFEVGYYDPCLELYPNQHHLFLNDITSIFSSFDFNSILTFI